MTKDKILNQPAEDVFYSILLLIEHPTLSVQTITSYLGVEPEYSWDMDDPGKSYTAWNRSTWTEGIRYFFDEISDVLCWLEGKPAFVEEFRHATGAKITLVANLSGRTNIGDELSPETMARASAMGVSIGVEVFPDLR